MISGSRLHSQYCSRYCNIHTPGFLGPPDTASPPGSLVNIYAIVDGGAQQTITLSPGGGARRTAPPRGRQRHPGVRNSNDQWGPWRGPGPPPSIAVSALQNKISVARPPQAAMGTVLNSPAIPMIPGRCGAM